MKIWTNKMISCMKLAGARLGLLPLLHQRNGGLSMEKTKSLEAFRPIRQIISFLPSLWFAPTMKHILLVLEAMAEIATHNPWTRWTLVRTTVRTSAAPARGPHYAFQSPPPPQETLPVRTAVTTLSSLKGRCMDAMVIGQILEFNLPRACVIRGLRFAGP